MNILIWLVNNIFAEPTILLGMIVMIGRVFQGRKFANLFLGIVKNYMDIEEIKLRIQEKLF